MSRAMLLLGAGGHGRVVADLAEASGWAGIAFLDDRWPQTDAAGAWHVLGKTEPVGRWRQEYGAAVATTGANATRLAFHRRLGEAGYERPILIHPRAAISRHATLGAGTVAMAGAVVNVGARIAEAVILNTACTVDHDCTIGMAVHISPGAHLAGSVTVGREAWIGIGAVVREGIRIGEGAIVAAGAAVIADVAPGARVGGVPARPLGKGSGDG